MRGGSKLNSTMHVLIPSSLLFDFSFEKFSYDIFWSHFPFLQHFSDSPYPTIPNSFLSFFRKQQTNQQTKQKHKQTNKKTTYTQKKNNKKIRKKPKKYTKFGTMVHVQKSSKKRKAQIKQYETKCQLPSMGITVKWG